MRKLINAYIGTIFLLFFMIALCIGIGWTGLGVGLAISGIFITVIMAIPMGEKKWHKSYEDMERDQKESIRQTRNASKLIDEAKKKLFVQNIMTKEQVGKILDRTYEETKYDK